MLLSELFELGVIQIHARSGKKGEQKDNEKSAREKIFRAFNADEKAACLHRLRGAQGGACAKDSVNKYVNPATTSPFFMGAFILSAKK